MGNRDQYSLEANAGFYATKGRTEECARARWASIQRPADAVSRSHRNVETWTVHPVARHCAASRATAPFTVHTYRVGTSGLLVGFLDFDSPRVEFGALLL